MKLTDQQMNHFRTFGFLIFRQLLSPEEMGTYNREFDEGLRAWLRHGQHDEVNSTWVPLHNSDTPFIASLLDDPRFVDVAEQVLDTKVLGIWSDAAWRAGDTNWHTDQVTSKYKAVKFAIYPDRLAASNGALRVIPGSNHESFSTQIDEDTGALDPWAKFGVAPEDLPAYVFESTPGDVFLFHNPTWHGAFGGSKHRRMGVVCSPKTPGRPTRKITSGGSCSTRTGGSRRVSASHSILSIGATSTTRATRIGSGAWPSWTFSKRRRHPHMKACLTRRRTYGFQSNGSDQTGTTRRTDWLYLNRRFAGLPSRSRA